MCQELGRFRAFTLLNYQVRLPVSWQKAWNSWDRKKGHFLTAIVVARATFFFLASVFLDHSSPEQYEQIWEIPSQWMDYFIEEEFCAYTRISVLAYCSRGRGYLISKAVSKPALCSEGWTISSFLDVHYTNILKRF